MFDDGIDKFREDSHVAKCGVVSMNGGFYTWILCSILDQRLAEDWGRDVAGISKRY